MPARSMFFVLPLLIGIEYDIFVAATLAIGLNTGAFLAEVFRAAIAAVPRGQWDDVPEVGAGRHSRFVVQ